MQSTAITLGAIMRISFETAKDLLSLEPLQECVTSPAEPLFDRVRMYQGEASLSPNTLYLADGQSLQHVPTPVSPNVAFLLAGKPPTYFVLSGTSFMAVPKSTNMLELLNTLLDFFERCQTFCSSLQQCDELSSAVERLSRFMGRSVWMIDSSYIIIALSKAKKGPSRAFFKNTKIGDMIDLDQLNDYKLNRLFGSASNKRKPFLYDEGVLPFACLFANLISDDVIDCRIVVAQDDRPFTRFDYDILQAIQPIMHDIYFSSLYGGAHSLGEEATTVIASILRDKHVAPYIAERVFRGDECERVCICAKPSMSDYSNKTLQAYCSQIRKLSPTDYVLEHDGLIVSLVSAVTLDAQLNKAVIPFVRDNDFRIGISERFTSIFAVRDAYEQALIALETGLRFDSTTWVYRFSEQVLDHIIHLVCESPNAPVLIAPQITALAEHDRMHGTQYIKTLRAYYVNNMNATQTARALFIHRATMVHRMTRIAEIAGIDFDNARKNLYYQISLEMLGRRLS